MFSLRSNCLARAAPLHPLAALGTPAALPSVGTACDIFVTRHEKHTQASAALAPQPVQEAPVTRSWSHTSFPTARRVQRGSASLLGIEGGAAPSQGTVA